MNCECNQYQHLELIRKAISKRIRETKSLKKKLDLLAENGEHKLWRCRACNQLWQSSRAWNWGAEEYLFKVPEISVDEWLNKPFIQPDEMLIHTSVMKDYMDGQTFVEKPEKCRTEGCIKRAIELSVFCLEHHVESLQNAGRLPQTPQGRLFPPYHFAESEGDI